MGKSLLGVRDRNCKYIIVERMDFVMDYEVVTLEGKIAVGVSARTSNAAPDMGAVIGVGNLYGLFGK